MGWELRRRVEASARCEGLARFALGIIADEIRDGSPEDGARMPYPALAARMGVSEKAAMRAVAAAVKAGDLVKSSAIGARNSYRLPLPKPAVVPQAAVVPPVGVDQSQNRQWSSPTGGSGFPTVVPPPPPPVQQKRGKPDFDALARASGIALSGRSPSAKKAAVRAQEKRDTRFELGAAEDHPAIKAHRVRCGRSTGLTPEIAGEIIAKVGGDVTVWDEALVDWMSRKAKNGQPYRAGNVTGQLENFENLRLHGAAVAVAPKNGLAPTKIRRQMEYRE